MNLCCMQSFYEGAADGVWKETGYPLFTRLAVDVGPMPSPTVASMWSQNALAAAACDELILGAVMASTVPLASIEDYDLIAPDDLVHTHVTYILTLGSRSSVRRRGIASALLQECVENAMRCRSCGAVYLHVKADNTRALRFYEKNGFRNLRFLEGEALCWWSSIEELFL